MIPILSLLVILGFSLIVTRVAAVALEHTGLSRDAARFQARSAFSGVGFTTREAEGVTSHPVRRRIVMLLMLIGNVGTASAMAALLLSAIDLQTGRGWVAIGGALLIGVALLCVIGSSRWVDDRMSALIRWALRRWAVLDAEDYARLLHLRDDYGVTRFEVGSGHWLSGKSLGDALLPEEGLLVLGIECPLGNWVGAPPDDLEIRVGDTLTLYGASERIAELVARSEGGESDQIHLQAAHERRSDLSRERIVVGR